MRAAKDVARSGACCDALVRFGRGEEEKERRRKQMIEARSWGQRAPDGKTWGAKLKRRDARVEHGGGCGRAVRTRAGCRQQSRAEGAGSKRAGVVEVREGWGWTGVEGGCAEGERAGGGRGGGGGGEG